MYMYVHVDTIIIVNTSWSAFISATIIVIIAAIIIIIIVSLSLFSLPLSPSFSPSSQVMRNLHVVFTMNPSSEGLKDRAATSPALFNRCVLNWFGDWSTGALYQVGLEFTNKVDLDKSDVRYDLYCCVNIKF